MKRNPYFILIFIDSQYFYQETPQTFCFLTVRDILKRDSIKRKNSGIISSFTIRTYLVSSKLSCSQRHCIFLNSNRISEVNKSFYTQLTD